MSKSLEGFTTALLTICALVTTAVVVRNHVRSNRDREDKPALAVSDSLWAVARSGDHFEGAARPKVTVVEFSDFECPACRAYWANVLPLLRARYANDVRLVFRHLPLPYHANAKQAAHAAECAAEQGRFWQMHDIMFEEQKRLGDQPYSVLAKRALVSDTASFQRCSESERHFPRIEADVQLAAALKVPGTPTVLIEGRHLPSPMDTAQLFEMIASGLKRAR